VSVAAGSANVGGIRAMRIGTSSASFIEIPVPNDVILQPIIVKEVVGDGDGSNKEFRTKFGWIRNNGTVKVYVNDVEQTTGITIAFDQPNISVFSSLFRNVDGYAKEIENMYGYQLHSIYAPVYDNGNIYCRESTSDAWIHLGYLQVPNTMIIPAEHRTKKFWKNDNARFDTKHFLQPLPDIVFENAPPAGSTIAVTYQPDCLAKDETKIINNISYTFSMNI
jgi:hypothetical protein